MHLIDHFDRGARISPDRPVYIFEGREWTYTEARLQNLRVANAMRAAGLRLGDKCAVIGDNHPESFNAMLGILRAGGIWIPVNAKNAVQAHVDLLGLLECDYLFFTKAYEGLIDRLAVEVPSLRMMVCIDGDSRWGPTLADLVRDAATDPIDLPDDNSAPVVIAGTGGTTGRPKGVVMSNRTWDCFIANMLATLGFDHTTLYLAAAPMTHAAGAYAFPVLTQGGALLFHRAIDPKLFIADIAKYRVTDTFLPPTATLAVLAQPNARTADFSSLRHYISTGAPMAPDRAREAIEVFGPVWTQLYGQTEALANMAILQPWECFDATGALIPERLETVGRATPFTRLAIMDEQGNLLPVGQKGEIVCRSDLVMNGYYQDAEATVEVSKFGWHHTGDVGALDDDGFLRILDRTKDMIISGGLNVFPSEIENWLMRHPAVHEAAVIGIPDDKWGEAVKAMVQLKPGLEVGEADLMAFCKEGLGSVKAPKSIEFVTAFPKSAVGKLLKKELRSKFWEGAGRQV